MVFTLVVSGTTSGFHDLVSTASHRKQLNKMRDSRVIGYSRMMGESMLSTLVIVLVCSLGTSATQYATGMNWTGLLTAGGVFMEECGLDPRPARTIMNVLMVNFAGTTLHSRRRAWQDRGTGRSSGASGEPDGDLPVVSAVPSICIANSRSTDAVWNLFEATNQLTACVPMLLVAVCALRFRNNDIKYALPLVVPTAWFLVMIPWAS